MFDRRQFLASGSAGSLLAALGLPQIAVAKARTAKRFVFINQRGGADGLAMIAAAGDPNFASLRGALGVESLAGAKLDSFFTLHSSLQETAKLYAAREALFVHAVASPYRSRSHFDAQSVLETGGRIAYRLKDGWMNRLLGLLPRDDGRALAVSATIPMVLRGAHSVASYAPSALPTASEDLLMRVAALYDADPQLHPLWTSAIQTREKAGDLARTSRIKAAAMGALAAKLLAGEDGSRIAAVDANNWDTHSNQRGGLATQLRALDQMIAALKSGLGADWAGTLVIVATEFGRTVAPNGTGGTDHGTGAAAMLLGGVVEGGKVIADWPGLSRGALYQGRDLMPTIGLDALIASALAQHYGLDTRQTMRVLFPDSSGPPLAKDLVRA